MEGADRVARSDPRKALQMLFDAAQCANYAGDLSVMMEAGRKASALPIRESEPEAPLVELLVDVAAMLQAKDTRFRTRLLQAFDRVADATEPRWLIWAGAAAAGIGDHARDAAFRRRAEAIARRSMAVGTLATVLERVAWAEMTHERVADASLRSEEGLQLALETGLTNSACWHRAILAWVAAVRGDQEACTSLTEQAAATAMKQGLAPHNSIAQWAVGAPAPGPGPLGQRRNAAARHVVARSGSGASVRRATSPTRSGRGGRACGSCRRRRVGGHPVCRVCAGRSSGLGAGTRGSLPRADHASR